MRKVILGMSGGVDSSVSAYLLKSQGYEVEGISFILWEARQAGGSGGCCSLSSTQSASRTAERLGIPHASVDVRSEFIERVIEPFADAYAKGLTPNPCILCNRYIKFPYLLKEAERRGADFISTGHYAKVDRGPGAGRVLLRKGSDPRKDQSYVLYCLDREVLERLVLPLGDRLKPEVREIARSLGLEAADRAESQEICFIEDNDYCGFLEKLAPDLSVLGPVMDMSGRQVGTHKGIHRYTIGQRKGLNIASLAPHYVVRIDPSANAVYVGAREDALCSAIDVDCINWLLQPGLDTGVASFRATVKVRSMMKDLPATVEADGDAARIFFDEPLWAPAPGQSAVFYDGDAVIGGGLIRASQRLSTDQSQGIGRH